MTRESTKKSRSLRAGQPAVLAALLAALCVVSALSPWRVSAQDLINLPLEDLVGVTVYGASKFEQKVTEAPASVTIVTEDDIKKYGYRTLADILRSVRGFIVAYDRNYSYLGVRGFGRTGDYNSRFLILIDGHRLNENIYDTAYIGEEFILDVDLIKRVEIIRGPSFSLYGRNAFLGIVNIVTRSGEELTGAEISGAAGNFRTYKGRVSYGARAGNGFEALLSGSAYSSSGNANLFYKEYDDPSTNNGVTSRTDYGRNYTLLSKLSFGGFTLEGAYISRIKGVPTGAYGTDFNDRGTQTLDRQGYVDLRYEHDFGNRTELIARAFYNAYRFDGDYVMSGVVNKEEAKGQWWGGEVQFTKVLFDRHRLLVGAEYVNNIQQDIRNYDKDPFMLYLDEKRSSQAWAAYVEGEFRIADTLILNVGVRHDDYENSGETTNPRLALIWNPLRKTVLKLLYGTAYRAPNVYELYFKTNPGGMKENPDLKPEKIETYQLAVEQGLSEHLSATVCGFYYRITDLINQRIDPADGLLVFDNIDEVKTKGFEVELDGKWDGLRGSLSYSYYDARDGKTDETPVNSPKHVAKGNVIVPIVRDRLFAGIELQYTGKRKTLAGNYAGDFFMTNLTLFSQKLAKGLEVSGSVYNIFDKKYGDPGGSEHRQDVIGQDGRNFRFKITYAF